MGCGLEKEGREKEGRKKRDAEKEGRKLFSSEKEGRKLFSSKKREKEEKKEEKEGRKLFSSTLLLPSGPPRARPHPPKRPPPPLLSNIIGRCGRGLGALAGDFCTKCNGADTRADGRRGGIIAPQKKKFRGA